MADFIMTIDSDTEEPKHKSDKTVSQDALGDDTRLNPEFTFDLLGDPYVDVIDQHDALNNLVNKGTKPNPVSVDDIIARRRTKKRMRDDEDENENEEEGDSDGDDENNSGEDDSNSTDEAYSLSEDPLATSEDEKESAEDDQGLSSEEMVNGDESTDSEEGSEAETQAEKDRKAAFFDLEAAPKEVHNSFLEMNLSRPIIKALTSLNFSKPTPIQASTIPVALLGKDIVGNAVTGSGKTAAFMIPMLERLLYREKGKKAAATRCLVLTPTRELGVQCYDVGTKLAAHTDISFCLVVGGLSLKSQEAALRNRPDIVIATPGRLIDHLRNTPSFTLDALDILVLDEADRMLSDGFADELAEIIKSCPLSRQTMLFSATMTDSVDELVKMSLNKPVRLFVDPKRSTARGLVQEFVRVRAGRESERSALVVALCAQTFKHKVIIFLRSKKLAHQIRIVFSLLGMKCEELHGDLTQEQRLRALQQFRDGLVDYLMATDLAARGLDIKGVETVINYDMPGQLAHYLHRVGRTARAGKKGRSVTLVGEADRKMLKAAIKHAAGEDSIRHRVIDSDVVQKWAARLEGLKGEIAAVLQEEKEEKQLRQAEMELKKGENMIEHEAEIFSRPARTWFQSSKEKQNAEVVSKREHERGISANVKGQKAKRMDDNKPKRDKFSGLSRRAKRRKMTVEEDKELGDSRVLNAAIRSAKRSNRPSRIGAPERRNTGNQKEKASKGSKNRRKIAGRVGSAFASERGRRADHTEGVRAKKGGSVGGGKKAGKRKSK